MPYVEPVSPIRELVNKRASCSPSARPLGRTVPRPQPEEFLPDNDINSYLVGAELADPHDQPIKVYR